MKIENRMPIDRNVIERIGTVGKITPDGRTILPEYMKDDIEEGLYDE